MITRKTSVFGILLIIFSLTLVAAAEPSATRNLPDCVQPGQEFDIEISASDYGSAAKITETLYPGWIYIRSSLADDEQVAVSDYSVIFTLLGETSFTYTVQAPATAGACCNVSGTIEDFNKTVQSTEGDSEICVCADGEQPTATPTATPATGLLATRDIIDGCIQPGEQLTVKVSASNYGSAAKITETLCNGWTYKSTSLADANQVTQSGNVVTFTLLGETSFTYTVQAPATAGACCNITGTIEDFDKNVQSVEGDSHICVCGEPSVGAVTRDLPDCIQPDEQFTVKISASGYGSAAKITETLCDGWTYKSTSLADANQVSQSGNKVTFTLLGETSFTYTVQAPSTEGECVSISGTITDFDKNVHTIGGDSQVCVCGEGRINLYDGWNFFSVPYVLENSSVEHVLDGVDYEAIVWYDASAKIWDTPSKIEPLTAYCIKVNGTQVIENIERSGIPTMPPSMNVYVGWNPVGLTGTNSKTAEFTFYVGGIDDAYSKVWGPWDPVSTKYVYHGYNQNVFGDIPGGEVPPDDIYTDNYMMNIYEGHWLYMTNNSVLSAIA